MKIRTQKEYDEALAEATSLSRRIKRMRKHGYECFHPDEIRKLPDLERQLRVLKRAIAEVELKVERKFF